MVPSGLCYLLLALAGVLGLGFGALLPAVQGYWPTRPWAGPAAAVAALSRLGTVAALVGAASQGAGPGLWAALGAAAAAGALVALAFRE